MARRDTGDIVGLEDVRERLESWRRTRTTRGIPEPLWRSAVRLARRAGVCAVARGLRLNYYSLQQRVDAADGSGDNGIGRRPAFVEIDNGSGSFTGGGLTVELSDRSGRRLVIRGPERGSVDLAALVAAFWSRGA